MTCARCVTPSTCSWNGCSPGTWPSENPSMPKTVKERQEDLRARRLMEGLTEVRGIFLHPELHAALKAEAKRLLKKQQSDQRKAEALATKDEIG